MAAPGIEKAENILRIAFDGDFLDILVDTVLEDGHLFIVVEGGQVALAAVSFIER